MLGTTDREQLRLASDNDWLLFTFDDDFLRLTESGGFDHAGIAYTNQSGMRIGDVVRTLDAFLTTLDPDDHGIHYL